LIHQERKINGDVGTGGNFGKKSPNHNLAQIFGHIHNVIHLPCLENSDIRSFFQSSHSRERDRKFKYQFQNFVLINMKNNGFVKEYVIGRKDQFDLDYAIFRKAVEETETREDMINYIEEKMQYVISRVASERAKTLMEEMELI